MKFQITYPQIIFASKEIELTKQQYEEVQDASLREKAAFVYHQLSPEEQYYLPGGLQGLRATLEIGYCPSPKVVAHTHQLPLIPSQMDADHKADPEAG